MLNQLRQRVLRTLAETIDRYPWTILCVAGVLVLASLFVTVTQLGFQTNRNDLISEELAWNRVFIEWQDNFSGNTDMVIVVSTANKQGVRDASTKQQAKALVDDLAPRLEALDSTESVLWGFEPQQANPISIQLLPLDEFEQQLAEVEQSKALLQSATPAALLDTAMHEMRQVQGGNAQNAMRDDEAVAGIRSFKDLFDAFTLRMQTPAEQPLDLTAVLMGDESDWEYFESQNGKMLFIRITPRVEEGHLTPFEATLRDTRKLMEEASERFPEVDFGLTGIEVIEADETEAFTFDATIASMLAAVLIATLLILTFQSIRLPLMLMVTLGVGVAWSFGFLTLAVGHLQVISVVFAAILLGLGVGFGIHLTTRYQRIRRRYADDHEGFTRSLEDTIGTMGPGVITGAITTSAAFCTTMLTDFRGVAEMGLIAAAGVILCLIAMFSVFPALLRIFKWRHAHVPVGEARMLTVYHENWVTPFARHPVRTLIGAVVVLLCSFAAITQMRFDYNLMDLLPENVDSVVWSQRVMTEGGESVYYGVSVCDSMEQVRERTDAFMQLPMVESVGGIGRLVPDHLDEKRAMLDDLREQMMPLIEQIDANQQTPDDNEQDLLGKVRALQMPLTFAATQAPEPIKQELTGLVASIRTLMQTADALDPAERQARLAAWQHDYTLMRKAVAGQIEQMVQRRDVTLDDMPPNLLDAWISDVAGEKRYALEIYSQLPQDVDSPLNPQVLGPFIEQMRTVDPNVTGVIVQIYESGRLIWTSYLQAGVLALLVVFVLVWIDFRNVIDALFTLVPVALGFSVTGGVMYLAGIQINPANIIVLPLMFGIGVDAGVHMIHRYRMSPEQFPPGLGSGTGKAITLTTCTTMIGFGSMMIASHRGIVSLGFVMAVGIGLTLLACLLVMPAILTLRKTPKPTV